jgi:hypothetical protein
MLLALIFDMTPQTLTQVLEELEDLRRLSFRLDAAAESLNAEQAKVEELNQSFQDASGLKTVFEAKTQAVAEKIKKIKSLIDL